MALLAGMPCRPHPHRKPARKNCSPTNTSRNNSPLSGFNDLRNRSISLKLWQGNTTRRSSPPNIFGSEGMASRRLPTSTLRAVQYRLERRRMRYIGHGKRWLSATAYCLLPPETNAHVSGPHHPMIVRANYTHVFLHGSSAVFCATALRNPRG